MYSKYFRDFRIALTNTHAGRERTPTSWPTICVTGVHIYVRQRAHNTLDEMKTMKK